MPPGRRCGGFPLRPAPTGGRNHNETCSGCIVSLTTPTRSSLTFCRSSLAVASSRMSPGSSWRRTCCGRSAPDGPCETDLAGKSVKLRACQPGADVQRDAINRKEYLLHVIRRVERNGGVVG